MDTDREAELAALKKQIDEWLAEYDGQDNRLIVGMKADLLHADGFKTFWLQNPDQLYKIRESLFDSMERLLSPTASDDFFANHSEKGVKDLRRLRRLMRTCQAAVATELKALRHRAGYLGIVLNEDDQTIRRNGWDVRPIALSALLFRLAKLFVKSGDSGVTSEQLDSLPGEATARTQAIRALRTKLTPLGLRITNKTGRKNRILVDDGT